VAHALNSVASDYIRLRTAAAHGGFPGVLHLLSTFLLSTVTQVAERTHHTVPAAFGVVESTRFADFIP
jgi:hypothetical protein